MGAKVSHGLIAVWAVGICPFTAGLTERVSDGETKAGSHDFPASFCNITERLRDSFIDVKLQLNPTTSKDILRRMGTLSVKQLCQFQVRRSFKGRFLLFQVNRDFDNLFSKLSVRTFYKEIRKFQQKVQS